MPIRIPLPRSIRAQLAALVLAVALPFAALIAFDYWEERANRIEIAGDSARSLASAVAASLAQLIETERAMLAVLASRPAQRVERPAECDTLIAGARILNPYRANVTVSDTAGEPVCSAVPLPAGRPLSVIRRDYAQRVLRTGEFAIGEPFKGPITGRWVVPLAFPRRDVSERLIGWVGVPLDAERISDLLAGSRTHRGDLITVISPQGMVISRSAEAAKWAGTDIRGQPFARALLDGSLAQWRGAALDGSARVWGAVEVPGASWKVIAGLDEARLLAPVNAALRRDSLLLALVLLLVAGLAAVIGRGVSTPVRSLAQTARRVAAGELDRRAPVEGATEIADIAAEFNRMLDVRTLVNARLRESNEKLRLFVDFAPSAIAMFDRDMRYIAYSRRWLLDYKLGDRDLTGLSHYAVFPDLPARWKEIHRRCLAGAVERAEEDPFPRADGSVDWVRWQVHPWLAGDDIGGLIVFSEVITDRKRAEEERLAASERFLKVFREAPLPMSILKEETGSLLDVNDAFCALFGYAREEMIGRTTLELGLWPDAADRQAMIDLLRSNPRVRNFEARRRLRSGELRDVVINTDRIEFGGETCVLSTLSDVTERRAAEAALRESEERYRRIVETAAEGIYAVDTQHRIAFANRRLLAMLGYELEDLLGRTPISLLDEASRAVALASGERRRHGVTEQLALTYLRKDGSALRALLNAAPIEDAEGRFAGAIGMISDITERERAEEALRRSEQRFRLAAATGNIWDADLATGTGLIPPRFKRALGYEDAEIENSAAAFDGLVHPEDLERLRQVRRTHFRDRTPYELEFRARAKAGDYQWYSTRGQAVWDEQGHATYMAGTVFDITERKRAEQALRDSEEKFRQLAENIHEVFWLTDPAKNAMLYVSPAYDAIWGRTRESLYTSPRAWLDAIHAEDRERVLAAAHAKQAAGTYDEEYRVERPDGTLCWIRDRAFPVRDASGAVYRIAGVAEDITERKRAQGERIAASARFEKLFLGAPEAMSISDLESGRFLQVNDAFCGMFGYARETVVGSTSLELNLWRSPERRAMVVGKVRAGEPVLSMEGQARTSSGTFRDTLFSADRIDFGGIDCLLLMFSDVTERKRAERTAQENSRRLSTLIGNLPGAAYRCRNDAAYTMEFVSEGIAALTGYPAADFLEHRRQFGALIHPKDRERVWNTVQEALGGNRPFEITYCIIDAAGAEKWVWERGLGVRDAGGELRALEGFLTDITDRKRAEEGLREANLRLHALSARLLEVQEQERAAIARELHDEIGQSLTALKLGAQALGRGSDAAKAKKIAEHIEIVDRTLAQTRNLALDLRPPQLDHLGLAAALRDSVARVAANAGLKPVFSADRDYRALDRQLATAAFRVAQEALTNVARHAGARNVAVELRMQRDELLLAVSDDGRGYDLAEARARALKGGSMGILGMEERVAQAGGQLKIVTRPGQGTRVQATFPLAPFAAAGAGAGS